MAIGPIELNGMIQRMDDVGVIKKQEDIKPMLDQQNIQVQVDKREDELAHVVLDTQKTANLENDSDAKEEVKGVYIRKLTKKRKEKKQDKVIKKNISGNFDIKI